MIAEIEINASALVESDSTERATYQRLLKRTVQ